MSELETPCAPAKPSSRELALNQEEIESIQKYTTPVGHAINRYMVERSRVAGTIDDYSDIARSEQDETIKHIQSGLRKLNASGSISDKLLFKGICPTHGQDRWKTSTPLIEGRDWNYNKAFLSTTASKDVGIEYVNSNYMLRNDVFQAHVLHVFHGKDTHANVSNVVDPRRKHQLEHVFLPETSFRTLFKARDVKTADALLRDTRQSNKEMHLLKVVIDEIEPGWELRGKAKQELSLAFQGSASHFSQLAELAERLANHTGPEAPLSQTIAMLRRNAEVAPVSVTSLSEDDVLRHAERVPRRTAWTPGTEELETYDSSRIESAALLRRQLQPLLERASPELRIEIDAELEATCRMLDASSAAQSRRGSPAGHSGRAGSLDEKPWIDEWERDLEI